jgi:aminopeptidase
MPSGEVHRPAGGLAEGTSATRSRRPAGGGRDQLRFEGGAWSRRAERGRGTCDHARHRRRRLRLGEIGIGTNYGITDGTGEILLDEKIGGTVHLAVGRSYPETGGTNESAIHWDMICDLRKGGQIEVDGEALQRDGEFVV